MKRTIAILGTLLIAAVLIISGSAVAGFAYSIHSYNGVTNRLSILGADDGDEATIGYGGGWIVVELKAGDYMDADQLFTVYSNGGGVTETYDVGVSEDLITEVHVGSGDDSGDQTFYTPSSPNPASWRYIRIVASSGTTGPGDLIVGPEIDAVGW